MCTESADIELDVVAEHFACCALYFVLVLERCFFAPPRVSPPHSVDREWGISGRRSYIGAVVRAERVDEVFLLVLFGDNLILVLTDQREEVSQVCGGKQLVLFMLTGLLEDFSSYVK